MAAGSAWEGHNAALRQFQNAEISQDRFSNSKRKNRLRSANIFGSKINTNMLIYTP